MKVLCINVGFDCELKVKNKSDAVLILRTNGVEMPLNQFHVGA